MGYYTDNNGLNAFEPDDTDDTIYLCSEGGFSLVDIINLVIKKWDKSVVGKCTIEVEHIHTRCIGYPHYDSGDYDDFIVIRKNA